MKSSGSKNICERYVSAIFDVAVQSGVLPTIEEDLSGLAALIKENSDFREFLHNPLLNRSAKAAIVQSLMAKIGTHHITNSFIALLAKNKRLYLLPEVISIFLERTAAMRGEMAAELVTARAISAKESATIAEVLGKVYNKKINLSTRQDKSLLGGAIVNVGSLRLDGSLAGKLDRLQQVLKVA